MGRRLSIYQLLTFALTAMLASGNAAAQTAAQATLGYVAAEVAATPRTFWTPHRILNTAPLDQELPAGFVAKPLTAAPPAAPAPQGGSGSPPSAEAAPFPDDLVHAPVDLNSLQSAGAIRNLSLGAGVFTESRVTPEGAVSDYPFRAVGKLYFHNPRTGETLSCGAVANSPRGILTAGRCVAQGSVLASQRFFYDNFMFIPAYDNGAAPYGTWLSGGHVYVSNSWFYSGTLPNPGDYAIILAADQGGKTLGSVVGWMGWQTYLLRFNHFTILGYPCNLDSCLLLQRNDAQTSGYGGNNTWIAGSDMGGGIIGGPWVQNFGVIPAGAIRPPLGYNVVVGVTSYVPANGSVGFLGASQFDQAFINLRNAFCAQQAGNC
jgi:hypothetical protein